MNKYKIPIIGRMIEKREAERKADELLKKYTFYKTEDAMQITVDRKMAAYKRNRETKNAVKDFFSYVFLYPLSKILKIMAFLSRLVMYAGVIAFFIGGYYLIKLITTGAAVDIPRMIMLLIAPFVGAFGSIAFSYLAQACWDA